MTNETPSAPWTPEQVKSANDFQQSGFMHPFTCGTEGCRADLVATEKGWICPNCSYTQSWAHDFMLDGSWRKTFEAASQYWKEF